MTPSITLSAVVAPLVGLVLLALPAHAHCDAVDGPVVSAARQALESNRPELVLVWVDASREPEARAAFARAAAVRASSPEAKDLAETWFFETVVRLHRASEGEPYEGLRPAGSADPAIVAVDAAVAAGSVAPLVPYVPAEARPALQQRLDRLRGLASRRADDLEAGRAWVRAYVELLHEVERLGTRPAPAAALKSPKPLADDHAELHERLGEAIRRGGRTAAATRELLKVLHPHFVREEQIAMPPLSLLPAIAEGRVGPEMRPALEMTRALRRELPRMLQEHVAIKAAFRAFGEAARLEGHADLERFSRRLLLHAETEEQVLYPASLLVGQVLEARLGR